MTVQPFINTVNDPELMDVLQQMKIETFRDLNCVKPGQIQSFDPSEKTVQVQILLKRILRDGTITDYPVLVDCPVVTLQGGGGFLQFPIQAGDQCLLLFSDRNIDAWFQNGSSQAPFDLRCHDLSDGFAIVGINALSSNLPDYEDAIAQFSYGGASVQLSELGIVTIQNGTTTLLTLLNGLIDVIEALTVQVGASEDPLTATSIAALEAYKLVLAELLG